MLLLELLQLLAGPFGQGGHPAAEHLRNVVAGPGLRGEHHRRQQRRLLRAAVVAQHRRVGHLGLPGEVGQLRRGDPRYPGRGITDPVDPPQVIELEAEVRPRRPRRGLLQPVEVTLGRRPRHLQQRLQPPDPGRADPPGDPREDLRVDLAPDRGGHLIQRGEPGQLKAALDQPLQRDIDQIRGVVLPGRGFPDRLRGHLARPRRIPDHPEPLTHQVPMPLGGTRRGIHRGGALGQPQITADVLDHHRRHLSQRREVPQPAETLRQDQQRQQMLPGPGHPPRPRHLVRLRRIEHVQLPRRWHPLEPRIRRPLDRGHPRRPPYDPTRSAHTDRGAYQRPQPGQRPPATAASASPASGNTRQGQPMAPSGLTLAAPQEVPQDMASPTWIISGSGGMTAWVASSTNIAWWHRFSPPTIQETYLSYSVSNRNAACEHLAESLSIG